MKMYNVHCSIMLTKDYEIYADSEDEAIDKVSNILDREPLDNMNYAYSKEEAWLIED